MSTKILLCEAINQKGMALLERHGFEVVVSPSTDVDTLKKLSRDVYGIIVRTSPLPREVIESASNLSIISRHGIGVDNIDVDAATERGILVSRVLNANAYSVAEYIIASMMTLGRNLFPADRLIRTGKLSEAGASLPGLVNRYKAGGNEIKGKKLGIIGFGSIGSIIAELVKSLHVSVYVYDEYVKTDNPNVIQVNTAKELYEISDFVTINVPLMETTKNLVTLETLKQMKPTAYLINASRGGIVNEADLAEALNQDMIAGAAVDVYSVEPPELDNPLFSAKNVILTPHIAGTTAEAIENLSVGSAQAIVDYHLGKTPAYVVNQAVLKK
ncbi:hydroxyacid dehydrogenase [Paenibacillus macerans]|uniref:hydroxyacid dehydrogenase n=1 Tax=Paenibacillus macerans TaxID=44252 RepID=UPI002040DDB5|nr:hydroxyacid dehydrogenase [Paenibacillus macerans]MCM3699491.1 hydroxyacid dehydrogenase [Paenibacillus macerans]